MKKSRFSIPPRYLLFIITFICIAFFAIGFFAPGITDKVSDAISSVVMPMQKGMSNLSTSVSDGRDNITALKDAQAENEKLLAENERLKAELEKYEADQYELAHLREILALRDEYPDYDIVAAKVIQKDSGSWFNSFVINLGSDDGMKVNMNVLSGDGLAGIITEVGKNYSRVSAIIDDFSNISAMSQNSGDYCMVSGDLEAYENGRIRLGYIDKNDNIHNGDKIVTSNISDKYLPGLLIGYAEDIRVESNNLTKSGYIVPVADFDKLKTVLVIKTLKVTGGKS
ncbi:MAG: rod shape-determining protein MreC [Lachnospiraceae bacterium]|nr:rod shape-determining protein MreC [Lachnospiraceae bacterium]